LIYENDSSCNQLSLSQEKTIPPLKEFTIRKYKIRTESEEANQSKSSLGFKNPERAVVELSDNNEINNMTESIPNQRMDLENEIINIIKKEHSKVNMSFQV